MYRNVGWWYLLPFSVAFGLFWYGYSDDPGVGDGLLLLGVVVVTSGVFYPINRKIGRDRYESEIVRLAPLLADLDDHAD